MESWRGIERHREKEIASVLSPSSMRYPRFRELGLRDLCANGERSFSLEPLSLPPPSSVIGKIGLRKSLAARNVSCPVEQGSRAAGVVILIGTIRAQEIVVRGTRR